MGAARSDNELEQEFRMSLRSIGEKDRFLSLIHFYWLPARPTVQNVSVSFYAVSVP
jgi:hypothetical protein